MFAQCLRAVSWEMDSDRVISAVVARLRRDVGSNDLRVSQRRLRETSRRSVSADTTSSRNGGTDSVPVPA